MQSALIKMPESGAVYQPTTVGYAYDTRDGSRLGIRSSFSRIMSRHKFSTRNWLEWVLFSVAVAAFIAGLTTMLVNLVSADDQASTPKKIDGTTPAKDSNTEIKEHSEDGARASIAVGAAMMLLGLLMGFIWAWLRFFRRGKSPRETVCNMEEERNSKLSNSSEASPICTTLSSDVRKYKLKLHVTTDQREFIFKFISDNPEIITHSSTKENERALWKELVTKLNYLKPERSIDNWKNFWQRWQASVGSKPESILTPLDCKLKVFIAKIMNNSETIEREDSRARYTIKEIEDTIRDIEKERSKQQLQIDENDYKIEIYKINIKRTNCTVKSNVLCLGRRKFLKNLPCNWTGGYRWSTALILSITLGGFGADRFYLGHWQEGIGKLFSFGGLGVWTLIDVMLISMRYLGPADGSLYI
ncbi:hypothetical protein TSAR_006269 [Trichomalopsis sarcophagae]|uniref:TM2 domain-containing protein n=1 Tax=Trichomalopsis sarcophagae TaxID=543379 RepID=A0A232F0B9_9HYME|nr:hypothetical protein TSAR_006269 [Trichomalopsis sarcophagae]